MSYTVQKLKKNKLIKKIFVKTFGCQMNEYDSNRIKELAKKAGYFQTQNLLDADCYVLNTCHIREKASDKVYHEVGRIKKKFRDKKKPILIVAGCVAQAEGDEMIKKDKYIDGVVGPQSYQQIPNILKEIESNKKRINSTDFNVIEKFDSLNLIRNNDSKISSFLTIQEGCDKFCNFCVVPYTRGPEHSRSFEEVIIEAKQLIENGSREITLLGQNVNAYNFGKYRLADIIYKLNELKSLDRIRFTTSHPKDMSNDLINAYKECEKLMPVLHLPVQSGSTKILRLMNRKHTVEEYYEIIDRLKSINPEIQFSSDFIIGYPGETDHDFEKTVDLMKKIKFINSYSYIYSPRPGTPASLKKTDEKDKLKERLIYFQKISDEIKKDYRKKLLDTNLEILFENRLSNPNIYFGRDKYQNSVLADSRLNLIGQKKNIKVNNFNHSTLFGNILKSQKKEFAV
ncbi:MAG: tRNA-2-methylthio-N6-dimethylallyladenosine synthase [Pelagibacterales bacterium]|nr:tRNA-2-methylthio-N6-dimethylallyladenosine synthase [Pelagibacterales bacterium]